MHAHLSDITNGAESSAQANHGKWGKASWRHIVQQVFIENSRFRGPHMHTPDWKFFLLCRVLLSPIAEETVALQWPVLNARIRKKLLPLTPFSKAAQMPRPVPDGKPRRCSCQRDAENGCWLRVMPPTGTKAGSPGAERKQTCLPFWLSKMCQSRICIYFCFRRLLRCQCLMENPRRCSCKRDAETAVGYGSCPQPVPKRDLPGLNGSKHVCLSGFPKCANPGYAYTFTGRTKILHWSEKCLTGQAGLSSLQLNSVDNRQFYSEGNIVLFLGVFGLVLEDLLIVQKTNCDERELTRGALRDPTSHTKPTLLPE